jgi:hypothetical protein
MSARETRGDCRQPMRASSVRAPTVKHMADGLCTRCYRRISKYGVTDNEWHAMFLVQDERCAICLDALTKAVVDHDHTTGKVRGLLCNRCNAGHRSLVVHIPSLQVRWNICSTWTCRSSTASTH